MTERRRRVRIPARIEAGTDNDAATTATRRRRRDEAHGSPSCCHSRCSLSCTPKRSQSLQPQPRCRSRPGGEVRIEAGTDDTRRPALCGYFFMDTDVDTCVDADVDTFVETSRRRGGERRRRANDERRRAATTTSRRRRRRQDRGGDDTTARRPALVHGESREVRIEAGDDATTTTTTTAMTRQRRRGDDTAGRRGDDTTTRIECCH